MSDVLLVTCAALPDGEDEGALLLDALAGRGVTARWVAWDDPNVAWSEAPLVAVRSPWDYVGRLGEFLAWAHKVGSATRLVNPAPPALTVLSDAPAPKTRSVALVVVAEPLLMAEDVPVPTTLTSIGLTLSMPEYSWT